MTEEEYFPLRKDGEINPELMSFSKLYLDEIVEKINENYNHALIRKFLEALDASGVQMTKDDVEWLVSDLLRSKDGFMELYQFLADHHPSLLNKMTLKNESGLCKEVVEGFKKFFLKPADDIIMNRLKEIAEEVEIDSDEENDKNDENDEKVDEPTKKPIVFNNVNILDTSPDDYDPEKRAPVAVVIEDEAPYGYVDTVLDKIAAVFDPEFAITSLTHKYGALKNIKDPLNTPANAPSMNYAPWARAILRELPRMPAREKPEDPNFPSIVFDFARACENDPNNRVAIMYLLPDYQNKLDAKDAAYRVRHHKGSIKLDLVGDPITKCRPPDDYAAERKKQIREYQTTVMPITLREYQKELVEKANKGDNTVVVAPTGSGKTVVAAQIMRHHVMTRKAQKKPYRMVMVVPKIPLVEQQQKQLYQYMSDVVYSTILHGDMMFEEQGKIDKMLCAELIVMTSQILINLLESMRAKERLFVSDITLLIMDECHHCQTSKDSNHPYSQLMSIVREWKRDETREYPQIVGLTASLGVGKDGSLNEKSAHEHVVGLLARMTAKSISTVNIYEKELQSHVQLPVDHIEDVERSNDMSSLPFTTKLRDLMNAINMEIRRDLQAMMVPGNNSGALIPQSLVKTQVDYNETEKYGGRIEAIKTAIRPMIDGAKKADLNMALNILKVCIMTWGMNDLLPSNKVWPMMKVEMHSMSVRNEENRFIKIYKKYVNDLDRLSEEEEDNGMLKKLRAELVKQFVKNCNSKVIIFVSTRELCQSLSEYINDRSDIIGLGDGRECGFIISSKARGVGTVSQSPADQKEALKKFRDNKLAVLVSTTVAEEGLDVPECNLIIKYNMTGNVISLTQQRGRARAKDSRSVLIVLHGSVKARELENANAEKMMNHIVRKINAEGEARLKDAIKRRTAAMEKEERDTEEAAIRKKIALQSKNFEIMCSNCNESLCDSGKIKKGFSHYFACDSEIWSRVEIDYADTKGKFVDEVTTVIGNVKCKGSEGKCKNDLGKVVRYQSCYLPALKYNSLQLRDKRENTIVGLDGLSNGKKNKWNDVCENIFYISKIDETNLREMMDALCANNEEIYLLLESRCAEIKKKTRRDALKRYEEKKVDGDRGAESD